MVSQIKEKRRNETMKKLYSKKLGGEAFALDAAQLDTLKKAG